MPGYDSNPDSLEVDWEIVNADGGGLEFKLKYKNPIEISQNDQPDKIKAKFYLS